MSELMGGTELLVKRLQESIDPELLSKFQIIPTRLKEPLDETKVRIAWIHDLADDPQLNYLANGGWKKFHLLVFVSNWQMQTFIAKYNIPWERCLVVQNAVYPLNMKVKTADKIKIIYTPTPHRGLGILVPVFTNVAKNHPEIELDVYSSFKLYGWGERDKQYEELFEACRNHPQINYHGSVPNDQVRAALEDSHIFAYPSVWQETSCMCLMEAMSAGLYCIHSNLAALPETACNLTMMYQLQDTFERHATILHNSLEIAIQAVKNDAEKGEPNPMIMLQKTFTDTFYNWENRKQQWTALLTSLKDLPTALEKPVMSNNMFSYRTN